MAFSRRSFMQRIAALPLVGAAIASSPKLEQYVEGVANQGHKTEYYVQEVITEADYLAWFEMEVQYIPKPTLPRPPEIIKGAEYTADYVRAVVQWDKYVPAVLAAAERNKIPLEKAEEITGVALRQLYKLELNQLP